MHSVGTHMGFMEFAAFFFTWWSFATGAVIGLAAGIIGSLALAPVAYRSYRRRILRREWRQNKRRELPEGVAPTWTNYDPDNETVDRRCVCHGRRIGLGERVLLWPEIGPLGMMHTSVYCESVKESV